MQSANKGFVLATTAATIACALIASIAVGKSVVGPNQPYVTCLGGVFYARSIPDGDKGAKGTTTIYRVRREADEVVERHGWYGSGGLHLGWSPIAGKVAAMAVSREPADDPAKQTEFSFHLGARHLASYTTADLAGLGAQVRRDFERTDRRCAAMRIVGCAQVHGTNDYVFRVVLDTGAGERTIDFDVLTGKPYDAATATTRPGHK